MIALVGLIAALDIAAWRLSPSETPQERTTEENQYPTKYISVFCPVASNNLESAIEQQGSNNQAPCIPPGTLADWAMVVVSCFAVLVAARTYRAVVEQSSATRRSVEMAEKHFALLNAQWLDVSHFHCTLKKMRHADGGRESLMWGVDLRISNNTPLKVTIKTIEVFVNDELTINRIHKDIGPRNYWTRVFPFATRLGEESEAKLRSGQPVGVAILGRITYINALDKEAERYFGKLGFIASTERTRLMGDLAGDVMQQFLVLKRKADNHDEERQNQEPRS
jgi:hypothetical protein